MEEIAFSSNSIPIRLNDERWGHICTQHAELTDLRQEILKTVSEPEQILAGGMDELLAVREIEPAKWLVVIYRELENDGFVITAFMTRRHRSLEKRKVLWSK